MEGLGSVISSIFGIIGDVLSPSIDAPITGGGGSESTAVAYAVVLAVPAALGILSLVKLALKKSGGKS